jgi:hypothetical protein
LVVVAEYRLVLVVGAGGDRGYLFVAPLYRHGQA